MKTENQSYELWINLPTYVKDVKSYLHLSDCEVSSFKFISDNHDKLLGDSFNNGDFNRWQVFIELSTPRKDVRGYLESILNCNLVLCSEKKKETANAN
jgi:hypothetical protein